MVGGVQQGPVLVGTFFTIRDDRTRGVKDTRSLLAACNVYKRQVPNFTYPSHLLRDVTKKDKKWHLGEE